MVDHGNKRNAILTFLPKMRIRCIVARGTMDFLIGLSLQVNLLCKLCARAKTGLFSWINFHKCLEIRVKMVNNKMIQGLPHFFYM